MPEEKIRAYPIEDLILYQLDPEYPDRTVLLGSELLRDIREELEQFL